jgi:hypothetical protein
MGGHQFFQVAAAAFFALNAGCLVEHQHLGHMAAIGAQKIKQWHAVSPLLLMTSVGTFPDLHPMMMPAHLARFEHRQIAGFDQEGIFFYTAFNGPVNGDAVVVELFQGTAADPADHDPVHQTPAQCTQRVAVAVLMVLIGIFENLYGIPIDVDKHKKRRRSEMAMDDAVQSFIFKYGKCNFHFRGSPHKILTLC